jgi:hypothetical protein
MIHATIERNSKTSLTKNAIDKVNTCDPSWVCAATTFRRSGLRLRGMCCSLSGDIICKLRCVEYEQVSGIKTTWFMKVPALSACSDENPSLIRELDIFKGK